MKKMAVAQYTLPIHSYGFYTRILTANGFEQQEVVTIHWASNIEK